MTTWSDLAAGAATDDLPALKAQLPILFVLDHYGVPMEQGSDGRWHAVCPFHDDSDPSLDVYGHSLERWGCFPCGVGGDVIDLIQKVEQLQFTEAKARAAELLGELNEKGGWTGPTEGVRRVFDAAAALELVHESEVADHAAAYDFLSRRTDPALSAVDPEWLIEQFRLGTRGAEVIIPYYDRNGVLVTYKHRTSGIKALSAPGSDFANVLYGEWRDDPSKPVLLCEGETDVWAAAWHCPDYSVMGLPTGAGANPRQVSRIAGRPLVIAFDGDAAGRKAMRRWATAHEGPVMVVPVPDDMDLANHPDLPSLIARARPVPEPPPGLFPVEGSGYVRPGKDTNTPVSNWYFEPRRELLGADGNAYEGIMHPYHREVVITSGDLSTKSRIVSWSLRNGGAWFGSDRDAQILLGQLQADGPFLSPGQMVDVAGLHDGHFLWPGGRIGPDRWVYVAPAADVHLEDYLRITPGDWAAQQVSVLLGLHDPAVTTPIMAWLAAAPLRSLLHQFPVLAVTGASGSGKTTLLDALVRNFSGSTIQSNLTSTTRHAIFSYSGCTNAFPVWFDEYRPGARKDALLTLDQVIRDAYTQQGSAKGGMRDQWAEVVSVTASAPLIVSGEDAFTETSHIDRMVMVGLPSRGRDSATLERVQDWPEHGLAYAYLTWLHEGLRSGDMPAVVNEPLLIDGLTPRQQMNMGLLDLGWTLLSRFCSDFGVDLGEPDWSKVVAKAVAGAGSSPIKDAILWALEEPDAMDFIKVDQGLVYVRVENFVRYVRDRSSFVLPGGSQAIRDYIIESYDAEQVRTRVFPMNAQRRALCFPADAVDYEV